MISIPVPTALHLGALHGAEWAFVLLLAFGPLLAAVGVVLVLRRREEREPLHARPVRCPARQP